MNKKGFIATSLLYSFFLLFCGLILLFIGNISHKSILFNKEVDKINEDLHLTTYLNNAKVGTYFRLNICIAEDKKDYFDQASTLDYMLFDNNNNNYALLISKNYSFKLNSLELLDNILNSIYVKNGSTKINSRSMTKNDYDLINGLSDKQVLIYSDFNDSSRYLLVNDRNNYSSSLVFEIKNKSIRAITSNDISDENTFVRLVFEINNSTMIIGGDGTNSNPYILKGGATSC